MGILHLDVTQPDRTGSIEPHRLEHDSASISRHFPGILACGKAGQIAPL